MGTASLAGSGTAAAAIASTCSNASLSLCAAASVSRAGSSRLDADIARAGSGARVSREAAPPRERAPGFVDRAVGCSGARASGVTVSASRAGVVSSASCEDASSALGSAGGRVKSGCTTATASRASASTTNSGVSATGSTSGRAVASGDAAKCCEAGGSIAAPAVSGGRALSACDSRAGASAATGAAGARARSRLVASAVSSAGVAGGAASGPTSAFQTMRSTPARSATLKSPLPTLLRRGARRLVLAASDTGAKKPSSAGAGSICRASEISSAMGPDENGTSSASSRARRSSTFAGAGRSGTLRSAVRSPESSDCGVNSRAMDATGMMLLLATEPTFGQPDRPTRPGPRDSKLKGLRDQAVTVVARFLRLG